MKFFEYGHRLANLSGKSPSHLAERHVFIAELLAGLAAGGQEEPGGDRGPAHLLHGHHGRLRLTEGEGSVWLTYLLRYFVF
jgi:hypothetical protein